MNRKKKALLLASALSLCVLCGCGEEEKQENEVIEIEGVTYLKSGDEYTRVDITPRVFEPGEHIIHYTAYFGKKVIHGEDGWGTSDLEIPETPEGYRYVETIALDEGGTGYTNSLVHIYVNEKRVEAMGVYNPKTNTVEYDIPGEVIEEKVLEMGD